MNATKNSSTDNCLFVAYAKDDCAGPVLTDICLTYNTKVGVNDENV